MHIMLYNSNYKGGVNCGEGWLCAHRRTGITYDTTLTVNEIPSIHNKF